MLLCSPHVFRKGLDSKPQLKRDELRRRQNVGVLAQMTCKLGPSNERNRERGFTMAELLIAVAIIAVLVAIAIPVFSAQLEKSREAVDLSTVRSAYADYQMCKMTGELPGGATESVGAPIFAYTRSGCWKQISFYDTVKKSEVYLTQSKSDLSEVRELFDQASA